MKNIEDLMDSEELALVFARCLQKFCVSRDNCEFCPFLKKNGDCKLAGEYDGDRPYVTPDMWEVD